MDAPTFDADGYPTEETLQALRRWPHADADGALGFARAAWHWGPEWCPIVTVVTDPEDPHGHYAEERLAGIESGERYVRFSTGGWSGNESIISALEENYMVRVLRWRLSAVGGLHIYRYGH